MELNTFLQVFSCKYFSRQISYSQHSLLHLHGSQHNCHCFSLFICKLRVVRNSILLTAISLAPNLSIEGLALWSRGFLLQVAETGAKPGKVRGS